MTPALRDLLNPPLKQWLHRSRRWKRKLNDCGSKLQALLLVRLHLPDGGDAQFDGWILNPFPSPQRAIIQLIGPPDWESEVVEVDLGPREQKEIRIGMKLPADVRCRRHPVGLDLVVGDWPFGQVSEALVTVGYPKF